MQPTNRAKLTMELECPECGMTDNYSEKECARCADCGHHFDGDDDYEQDLRVELVLQRFF